MEEKMEKIEKALYILAQAIEDGSISGIVEHIERILERK